MTCHLRCRTTSCSAPSSPHEVCECGEPPHTHTHTGARGRCTSWGSHVLQRASCAFANTDHVRVWVGGGGGERAAQEARVWCIPVRGPLFSVIATDSVLKEINKRHDTHDILAAREKMWRILHAKLLLRSSPDRRRRQTEKSTGQLDKPRVLKTHSGAGVGCLDRPLAYGGVARAG
jgi:hypothetical protein